MFFLHLGYKVIVWNTTVEVPKLGDYFVEKNYRPSTQVGRKFSEKNGQTWVLLLYFFFRLGTGIEQIQKVQLDTDRLRSQVEDAGKRAKNEVNQAFQQLCALLEKRKSAMISQIQSDVNEQVGILSDMCTRY